MKQGWILIAVFFFALPLRAADVAGKILCEKNLSVYKDKLNKNPQDDAAWTELRACALELKKWDEAIQIALAARHKNRDLPQPYLILGLAQMHQKNFERAIEHFDQTIGLKSDQPVAYFQMGMAYLYMNEGAQAAQAASRAVELDPANPAYHRQLAYTQLLMKDIAAAERSAKQAIALDPKDVAAHKILAKIYVKGGKPDEAAAEADLVRKLEGEYTAAHPELVKKPEPEPVSPKEKDDDEDKDEDYELIGQCIGQWESMRNAVFSGDIPRALNSYSDYLDTRDQYKASFDKLGLEKMKSIFGSFGELYDCEVVFAAAHCKSMIRSSSGAVTVAKIRFERNPDKVWRIRSF